MSSKDCQYNARNDVDNTMVHRDPVRLALDVPSGPEHVGTANGAGHRPYRGEPEGDVAIQGRPLLTSVGARIKSTQERAFHVPLDRYGAARLAITAF